MKVKSIFSGSALLCLALLNAFLIFSARPLVAETLPSHDKTTKQSNLVEEAQAARSAMEAADNVNLGEALESVAKEETFVVPPTPYVATAYSLRGRTASGLPVAKGLIAADPRHLPLGSRVRLEAGAYSGEYLVADTGGLVRGRRIDIWTPSSREAMRFGRRTVKLTVLSLGGKKHKVPRVKQ
ncbi:MAG TPA: 3D domain-containing protein [Pyrinomonadaceae bacterium]|nr:3D domain-containing protein [Pyrinomonadaceae bacterium]